MSTSNASPLTPDALPGAPKHLGRRRAPRTPRWVPGHSLTWEDQRHVLAAYVHRSTGEHTPPWARLPRPDGQPYTPQYLTDAQWLQRTQFAVRTDGRLDGRVHHCRSDAP